MCSSCRGRLPPQASTRLASTKVQILTQLLLQTHKYSRNPLLQANIDKRTLARDCRSGEAAGDRSSSELAALLVDGVSTGMLNRCVSESRLYEGSFKALLRLFKALLRLVHNGVSTGCSTGRAGGCVDAASDGYVPYADVR